MDSGHVSRLLAGTGPAERRWRFAVVATVAATALSLSVQRLLSPDWWEAGGLPLALSALLLVGFVGGVQRYGYAYAVVPGYVFLLTIFPGAYLLRTSGPEPVVRRTLGLFLLPLLVAVPVVAVGYALGVTASRLSRAILSARRSRSRRSE